MTIQIVKLITGEDILTEVEDIFEDAHDQIYAEDKVKLVKPMMLIMQQQGMQMVPWLMLAKKEEVIIGKDRIVFMYDPRDELVSAYQQQTGQIVTAPAGVLDPKGKLVM